MNLPKVELQHILKPPQRKEPLTLSYKIEKKDKGIDLHPKAIGILQDSFIMGVLGQPASGKSTLIESMIKGKQFFSEKFDRILYVGNCSFNSLDGKQIIFDQHNFSPSYDINWIFEKISEASKWNCQNMLIVLDDIVSNMKDSSISRRSSELCYNRRHLLKNGIISIIITSQKWTSFPKYIRSTMTQLVTFQVNKSQVDSIWKQTNTNYGRSALMSQIGKLKQHEFIYINMKTGKIYNRIWDVI